MCKEKHFQIITLQETSDLFNTLSLVCYLEVNTKKWIQHVGCLSFKHLCYVQVDVHTSMYIASIDIDVYTSAVNNINALRIENVQNFVQCKQVRMRHSYRAFVQQKMCSVLVLSVRILPFTMSAVIL